MPLKVLSAFMNVKCLNPFNVIKTDMLVCVHRSIKNESKILIFISYPSILTFVSGALKNCLIEMVLLSTHNIHFG